MGKVRVVRNNEVIAVDESKVEEAREHGFAPVTDEQAAKIKAMREASTVGGEIRGTAEAVFAGATFGGTDWLLEKGGADPEGLAARREGKGAAEFVGAVVPAVLSGGVGAGAKVGAAAAKAGAGAVAKKGLATVLRYTPAGAAARVGGSVARGRGLLGAAAGAGIEGGAQGFGMTFSEQALGGPDVSAERLLANTASGFGIGAIFGAGVHATGGVLARASRPKAGLASVLDEGAPASSLDAGPGKRWAETKPGKLARKAWSLTGAADDDIVTVLNAIQTPGGRKLVKQGPDALKRSREELGYGFKGAVDSYNGAVDDLIRHTGGDTRIGNAERLLTSAENATAPRHTVTFMRKQMAAIDERMADDLLSAPEKYDLREIRRMHARGLRDLKKQGVTGAEAFRIVDKVRQDTGAIKRARAKEGFGPGGTREAQRAAKSADEINAAYRAHSTDETIFGAAGKEHAENLQAWAQGIEAVSALKSKSPVLAKLFEKGANDADITPLMTLARGRAGKTREDLFDGVFTARDKMIGVLKKNHDLPPDVLRKIDAIESAKKDMDRLFKQNADNVETVEALWRVRQQGESGFSPSNVGAKGASAIAGAAGFAVGGLPGAAVGAAVGAASKPFTAMRWLAGAADAIEHLKLREHGIVGGISKAMDGTLPKVAKAARGAVKHSGGIARRGGTTAAALDRRRKALAIRDKVNAIVADPSALERELARSISWDEAPETAKQQYLTAARAAAYLKAVEPRTFKPLYGGTELIDPAEIESYERSIEGVTDPYGSMERLLAGGMAIEHLDAIEAVYPRFFNRIRDGILEEVGSRAADNRAIDYRVRSRLGRMLKLPLDDTQRPGMFEAIQIAITPSGMPGPEGEAQGRGPTQIEDIRSENAMTSSERRESGIDRA